jgi:acyl-CoA synthetase (AMP-forming)/AMP-acid ligase II
VVAIMFAAWRLGAVLTPVNPASKGVMLDHANLVATAAMIVDSSPGARRT